MTEIKRELEINCISHFCLSLTVTFDNVLEVADLPDTIEDCETLLNDFVSQFKNVCEANGFKYIETYKPYAVFKERGLVMFMSGDLHEPFTDYLVEKLKADARLEITAKS